MHSVGVFYIFILSITNKLLNLFIMTTIKLTKSETKLLQEIMNSELEGLGTGFSIFDGDDIHRDEKWLLSSLIRKGLVYDSTEGDCDEDRMYCTNPKELQKVVGLDLKEYNLQ